MAIAAVAVVAFAVVAAAVAVAISTKLAHLTLGSLGNFCRYIHSSSLVDRHNNSEPSDWRPPYQQQW